MYDNFSFKITISVFLINGIYWRCIPTCLFDQFNIKVIQYSRKISCIQSLSLLLFNHAVIKIITESKIFSLSNMHLSQLFIQDCNKFIMIMLNSMVDIKYITNPLSTKNLLFDKFSFKMYMYMCVFILSI
jgi:sRNA-binding regulator protein Hfq